MNKRSLTIGILVTVIWIAIIVFIYLFTGLEHPKSLNEFGDFLAGVFAPVAFFWLRVYAAGQTIRTKYQSFRATRKSASTSD
jgi:hypothetical protein